VAGGGGGVWVGLTGGGCLALSREHPGTPPCLVVRPACLTPRALTVYVCVGCGCMYSALYDLWRAVVFVCWLLTLKKKVVAHSSLMLLTCRALHNGCPRRCVPLRRSHAYNDGRRLLAAFWCERKASWQESGVRGWGGMGVWGCGCVPHTPGSRCHSTRGPSHSDLAPASLLVSSRRQRHRPSSMPHRPCTSLPRSHPPPRRLRRVWGAARHAAGSHWDHHSERRRHTNPPTHAVGAAGGEPRPPHRP